MKRARLTGIFAATLAAWAWPASAGEVVWWPPNWSQQRAEKLSADFEAANPTISIRREITTSTGLPQRIATALQSGAVPDIIEAQIPWINGFAASDLLLPVDDAIKDAEDYPGNVLGLVTSQGKLWGVPYRIDCPAMLYNRGDFAAAGLDPDRPPQTWTEWDAAAKALTRNGKYGQAITGGGEVGNTITRTLPLIWMNGGDVIDADGRTAVVNSAAAVAAVKFYTDFYRNGYSPESTLQNDGVANRQLFVAGKVSMFQTGSWDIAAVKTANPSIEIGVAALPHPDGKETACVIGGWAYIVPASAKNPEEAKKFLEFLNTTENQAFFTDTFPARTSSTKLPRYDDPLLQKFAALVPFGRAAPIHPQWVQISQAMFDGIQRILTGDQDAETSMQEANEEIQALLDSN